MSIVKRTEIDATYYDSYAELNNDGGSSDLVENLGTDCYIEVMSGSISVIKPAYGSDGEVRLIDTLGNVIRVFNADQAKDFQISPLKIGPGVGLKAVIANAGSTQAKASVNLSARIALR